MAKVRIEYLLSEEGRKKSLLAGGDGRELQVIETEATPELIELGRVDKDGNVTLKVGFSWYDSTGRTRPWGVEVNKKVIQNHYSPGWSWATDTSTIYFDEPQSVESLIAWEKARLARLREAETDERNKAEIKRLNEIFNVKEAQRKQQEEERRRREEEERRRKEEERRRLEQEKAEWVEAHGSDYLKRALRLGYDCQRQYVTERAAKEFPDYTVDFDNDARWRSRSCPSPEALEEVERLIASGYDAQVVWLTAPPYELEYDDIFDECEAIIIFNYLGKYNLVKAL
jgi:hypothetical protein